MTENEDGAGASHPDAVTCKSSNRRQTAGTPTASHTRVAWGEFHPPTGRRHLGVVLVRGCPACGSSLHLHRASTADSADGTFRTGSCGATYLLRVRPALRARGAAA